MESFNGKVILLTGGTGSFGKAFTSLTLSSHNPRQIIIFSRDEMKQWEMAQKYANNPQVIFKIGDVRDRRRLAEACEGVDFIVHAAATKIVPTAEYNPAECIKTNIDGALNVVDVAREHRVKRVVALSTDKACNPVNLYGATKLASDKMFVASNSLDPNLPKLSVVRYGNVMGSRGSVIPFFLQCAKEGYLPITDERMTRFMISLEEAVKTVWLAFNEMHGGEIFVKKIPSMGIMDIAKAIDPSATIRFVGVRPGEKIHEQMINEEDAQHTFSYNGYYKILPAINDWSLDPTRIGNGVSVGNGFSYSSDNNEDVMTSEILRTWISANVDILGKI